MLFSAKPRISNSWVNPAKNICGKVMGDSGRAPSYKINDSNVGSLMNTSVFDLLNQSGLQANVLAGLAKAAPGSDSVYSDRTLFEHVRCI